MESRNPVIARMEKEAERNGGYAGFGATATATAAAPDGVGVEPAAPPQQVEPLGAPMTVNDVVVRTAAMFVPLLITAYLAWTLQLSGGIVLIAMLGAFGLAIWGIMSKKPRPLVSLAYAALEGIVLGSVSYWLQQYVNETSWAQGQSDSTNIVAQAVIGTLAAFAAVLFLYATRIIKVTNTFKKMMMIAMVAYLGIAIVSVFFAIFAGTGDGFGFYGVSGIGLLLCAAGVLLAAFSLALDFDAIEKSVAYGVPEQEAWRAALGLTITLVWLYLEILRLLAIVNSR